MKLIRAMKKQGIATSKIKKWEDIAPFPETVDSRTIDSHIEGSGIHNDWMTVLRVLDQQPITLSRYSDLVKVCDIINAHLKYDPYHVMTLAGMCYIIRKPTK